MKYEREFAQNPSYAISTARATLPRRPPLLHVVWARTAPAPGQNHRGRDENTHVPELMAGTPDTLAEAIDMAGRQGGRRRSRSCTTPDGDDGGRAAAATRACASFPSTAAGRPPSRIAAKEPLSIDLEEGPAGARSSSPASPAPRKVALTMLLDRFPRWASSTSWCGPRRWHCRDRFFGKVASSPPFPLARAPRRRFDAFLRKNASAAGDVTNPLPGSRPVRWAVSNKSSPA